MGSSLPQKCTSSGVAGNPIPLSPLKHLLGRRTLSSYVKEAWSRLNCHCEGRQPRGNLGIGGLETPAARVTMAWHEPCSLGKSPRNDYIVVSSLYIV